MRRRQFLKLTGMALAATALDARVFAAERGGPRFLLVFLRGGYDCANALVPYSSAFYYESRPNIAVARPDDADASGALRLDAEWALAPALRGSVGAMYARGEAAFVPFAGTDDLSRSHFETQDHIESGQPAKRGAGSHSGFLARLAAETRAAPIAFTEALPLALQGAGDVPNVSLRGGARGGFDEAQAATIASMYRGHALAGNVDEGIALRQELASDDAAMRAANRGAANARGLDRRIGQVARLMREQYPIGFIDVGGWDTHVNQGGAQGQLADNLAGLGAALEVFAREMGATWKETTVVVLSEFGRTFRENGNRGTDHGHGSALWVLGGAVRGGRIVGEQARVDREHLLEDRDFVALNDYRAVLGGVFRRLWDLTPAQLERVFPGAKAVELALL